eukprot:m51a1_g10207 hypothetical protein (822) ;mRNA; r:69323-77782
MARTSKRVLVLVLIAALLASGFPGPRAVTAPPRLRAEGNTRSKFVRCQYRVWKHASPWTQGDMYEMTAQAWDLQDRSAMPVFDVFDNHPDSPRPEWESVVKPLMYNSCNAINNKIWLEGVHELLMPAFQLRNALCDTMPKPARSSPAMGALALRRAVPLPLLSAAMSCAVLALLLAARVPDPLASPAAPLSPRSPAYAPAAYATLDPLAPSPEGPQQDRGGPDAPGAPGGAREAPGATADENDERAAPADANPCAAPPQRQTTPGARPLLSPCAQSVMTMGLLCSVPPRPHTRAPADADRDNTLANPRFEQRDASSPTHAAAWAAVGSGYALAETAGRTGGATLALGQKCCLALRPGGGAQQRVRLPSSVAEGACVFLSAWARSPGSAAAPEATLVLRTLRGGAVVDTFAAPLLRGDGGDWRLTYALRSATGAFDGLEVSVRAASGQGQGEGAGAGVLLVDDVKATLVGRESVCPVFRTLELDEYAQAHARRFEEGRQEGSLGECGAQHCGDRKFFLVWSTPAATFGIGHLRTVESIAWHHPRACVCVYSNTLPLDWFHDLFAAGYNVRVVRHRIEEIGRSLAAGSAWAARLDEWRRGPYWYSHQTDFLRFALLYKYGGVYSDTDSILLRPLDLDNTIATMRRPDLPWAAAASLVELPELRPWSEVVRPNASADQRYTLAPGFMAFDRGSPLLERALRKLDETYEPRSWVAAGPRPVTLAYAESADDVRAGRLRVELHRPSMFLPVSFSRIGEANAEPLDALWATIKRECRAFHLYGRVQSAKGTASVVRGSLTYKVLTEFATSCVPVSAPWGPDGQQDQQ